MLKEFTNFLLTTASFLGIGITIWQDIVGGGDTPVTPSWVLTADGAPAAIDFDFINQQAYVLGATGTPDSFLTCARASNTAYTINSSGSYVNVAANVLRYYYDPSTLVAQGVWVEEQRTNFIRVNDGTGAVAGPSRTITNITNITRTASATAVLACTSDNCAANDLITVSGCAVADYNGTFRVASATGSTVSYVTATSTTDSCGGTPAATAVGPGSNPTGWATSNNANGISASIVGSGTANGIGYVDYRIAGLAASTTAFNISFEASNQVTASNGQTWAESAFILQTAGTTSNINQVLFQTDQYTAANAFIVSRFSSPLTIATTGSLAAARQTYIKTLDQTTTGFARPMFAISATATGQFIDVTYRIGWPQFENTNVPVIPNAVTAVVTGGASYNNGDTITLTGGSFTTASVLTVTNAIAGVIQAGGVSLTTAGSYTVFPPSPVAQGSTSGTGSGATFTLTCTDNTSKGSVTSPIKTVSVSQIRNSDKITLTLNSVLQSLAAYTLYNQFIPDAPTGYNSNQFAGAIADNTTNPLNRAGNRRTNGTGTLGASVLANAATTEYDQVGAVLNPSVSGKLAVAQAANNNRGVVNGTLLSATQSGSLALSNITTMWVGANGASAGAAFTDGKISRQALWNFRVSNTGIQTLTT